MIIDLEKVACPLQDGGEFLPHVEEFKYLWDLFTTEGRRELVIVRQIGTAVATMQTLQWSFVLKRKLSHKTELLIYLSVYGPTPSLS